jgi:phosphohistidine phosphatase SixA
MPCLKFCRRVVIGFVAVAFSISPRAGAWAESVSQFPISLILIRHADPQAQRAGDDDPPLSESGSKRAQDLAVALRDAGVTAILTTELRRTRETAAPLARALGLTPEAVPVEFPISKHVQALENAVQRHAAGVVLVVGHSNTIPAFIAKLRGPDLPQICDAVYDKLFTLFRADGKVRLIRSRYGAATPDLRPECQ